jgi:hypothetical protein
MLTSGCTSIRSLRLPLNHVQIIVYPLSYHRCYDIQSERLRARKINTNIVNVIGFKLLTAVIMMILLDYYQSIDLNISEDLNLSKNVFFLMCNELNFTDGEGACFVAGRNRIYE